MITQSFIHRLESLFVYYSLTPSAFADSIGIQRSSISHLLSGRNKPSLDFILKLIEHYPEVDLMWILNGKGVFPKVKEANVENSLKTELDKPMLDLFSEKAPEDKQEKNMSVATEKQHFITETLINNEENIERIVIFYKNGTFKNYINQ